MREQVLRAATLCYFGNDYLRSADESLLTEVYLKTCFKGVENLAFVRPNAHQFAGPGAGFVHGSKTWYRRLKVDGVEQLRLHLPLSLLEALPAQYGIVTDGDNGSDIWVPSQESSARNVEYDAQRFAIWSLSRAEPPAASFAVMIQAIAALNETLRGQGTSLSNRLCKLASILGGGAHAPSGFDDSIPSSFDATHTAMAKSAIHTIVTLSSPDLGLDDQPSQRESIDLIWKQSLRLLEAISCDVTTQAASNAA